MVIILALVLVALLIVAGVWVVNRAGPSETPVIPTPVDSVRQRRQWDARLARLDHERQRHTGRIMAYRMQRGLPVLSVGRLTDLTPRQQRRIKHKFSHPEGVELAEVFDGTGTEVNAQG
jgi:hypothetical protein